MYAATVKSDPKNVLQLSEERPNHTNMPSSLKQEFETKSLCSFDDVKIHYRSEKPARLGALAYTKGPEVFISPGQERHLRHELVHVAQQKQGLGFGSPTSLEQEAEQGIIRQIPMAERLVHMVQCRLLTPKDVDEILVKKGYPAEYLPPNIKEHICRLVGDIGTTIPVLRYFFKNNTAWNIAERIVAICLEPTQMTKQEPQEAAQESPWRIAEAKLTLLDTAFQQGTLAQTIAILEGKTKENQIIVAGYDGDPKNNTLRSIPDILKRLTGDGQQTRMLQLINRLLPLSTVSGVLSVLEGANMNVRFSILRTLLLPDYNANARENEERNQGVFLKRLSLMVEFIEKVAEEPIETPNGKFQIKDLYFIESTGSDPHKEGHHALFLIPKAGGERVLYKPRSLQVDQTVSGPEGVMASLGESKLLGFKTAESLPSMDFLHNTQLPSKDSLRREQFVHSAGRSKKDAVTWEDALRFCRQLGAMEAIAEVCGITDLHTDNIIFTKKGPIIIDAECSFLDYSGTILETDAGPLNRSRNSPSTGSAASLFYYRDQQEKTHTSSGPDSDKALKAAFQDGKKDMYSKLEGMTLFHELRPKLEPILRNLDHIRLVPISTDEFAQKLDDYIYYKNDYESMSGAENCTQTISNLRNSILEDFTNKKWLFHSSPGSKLIFSWVENVNAVIDTALTTAFDNGTIPAFYMDYQHTESAPADQKSQQREDIFPWEIWQIRLDDVPIATLKWPCSLQSHIIKRMEDNILSHWINP